MFEKLNSPIRTEHMQKVIEIYGGFAISSVILAVAFSVGQRDVSTAAELAVTKLGQLEVKIDRLQKKMDLEHACSSKLPNAVRTPRVK